MVRIIPRPVPQADFRRLLEGGFHPVLARVYAARGIRSPAQLGYELGALIPAGNLKNAPEAAILLADAIQAGKRLMIVADYDSDGATACAVAVRALRSFGARVEYLVPNRFEYGYGLTPEIVRLAAARHPDLLVTVDNGIASCEGVAEARRLGMEVLVTDHHLPGDELPQAACIVNPNAEGMEGNTGAAGPHPLGNLAGVGVIFYVMLALRAELRRRGAFGAQPLVRDAPPAAFPRAGEKEGREGICQSAAEPNLGQLLDLVALGTVADVVRLDDNNRILVHQGLKRIRAGRGCAGIEALMTVAGRNPRAASVWDLGFAVGPRLNAAGRLDDMSLGIECLITDDPERALAIARQLDALNRERRAIEADMKDSALAALDQVEAGEGFSLSLYDPGWHQGVIGILASRLKDRFHRPVIAFAPGADGELKGSGRSIRSLHLRDALDLVAKRKPHVVRKFGGHAFAAGVTIPERHFQEFAATFEAVARSLLTPADLEQIIETDDALAAHEITFELADMLGGQVWGQGFPQPSFTGEFTVENQRVVGEKHLKLSLGLEEIPPTPTLSKGRAGQKHVFDAMLFFHNAPLPERITAVYHLDINEFNGTRSLQLVIEHWEGIQDRGLSAEGRV
jgi:single-stranded-DNA-specific exonuclease